jgi:hypothetical protein
MEADGSRPVCADVVAAKAGHTPRPCAAMEAARSGVSLLPGGSTHLHLVDLRCAFDPACSRPTVRLAPLDRDAPPLSCRFVGYTKSPVVVSFWFARSLIGIESPTVRRPRAFYSGIGINFIDTISEYYVHLLRATGLLLCIGPQHRCPCVRFAVASPSSSSVHRQLCCAIPATPSVCTRSSFC